VRHDISTLTGRVDAQAILRDVAAIVREAVSALENYDDDWDGFGATLSSQHSMESQGDGTHDTFTSGSSTNASDATTQQPSSTDDLTYDQELQQGVRTFMSKVETLMSTVPASEGGSNGSESV
jgi:hypothetical protein